MIRSAKRNTIAIAIGANLLSLMILAAVPPSAQADSPGSSPALVRATITTTVTIHLFARPIAGPWSKSIMEPMALDRYGTGSGR